MLYLIVAAILLILAAYVLFNQQKVDAKMRSVWNHVSRTHTTEPTAGSQR